MDDIVRLHVPHSAHSARLLTRNRRWGILYRTRVGDSEGGVEFRQIDPSLLDADHVDRSDPDAVIAAVERRLVAAGYEPTRRHEDSESTAASWDIEPRTTT